MPGLSRPALAALLDRKGIPYVTDARGRLWQIPAGGEGDPLDALAPSAAAPAAPTATPATPAEPTSGAPAPVAPTPAAAAPSAPAVDLNHLARELGYDSVDDYKADLAFARRARGEFERRQALERQQDPGYQARARQNATLDEIMVARYGREVADALPVLPELANALHLQRAEGAHSDMLRALDKAGMGFDESPEGREGLAELEDRFTDQINASERLVKLYNGTPAQRRECIQELVDREEKYVNRHLLRANAATLREHAARRAAQPRAGRSVTVTPAMRREPPKATDPLQRRREANANDSRTLDDIYAFTH